MSKSRMVPFPVGGDSKLLSRYDDERTDPHFTAGLSSCFDGAPDAGEVGSGEVWGSR
jgi:hypothetical protein